MTHFPDFAEEDSLSPHKSVSRSDILERGIPLLCTALDDRSASVARSAGLVSVCLSVWEGKRGTGGGGGGEGFLKAFEAAAAARRDGAGMQEAIGFLATQPLANKNIGQGVYRIWVWNLICDFLAFLDSLHCFSASFFKVRTVCPCEPFFLQNPI